MFDRPGQHVRDRFDAAVRVPGETCAIALRIVISEVVQKQKRVHLVGVAEAKGAAEMNARSLSRRLGLDDASHWSDGHPY